MKQGQGEPRIQVSTAGLDEVEIKATVEISGLPKNCPNIAFNTGNVFIIKDPAVVAEYERISFREEKIRLRKVIDEFIKNKEGHIVIIYFSTKKDSNKALQIRISNITKYLTETLKISKDRFELVFGGYSPHNFYRTEIYFIPDSPKINKSGRNIQ